MRAAWALLGALLGAAAWYEGLDNRWNAIGPSTFSYTFEETSGATCEPDLLVTDLSAHPSVARHLCATKCRDGSLCSSRGGAECFCTGAEPAVDVPENGALCLPPARLQAACALVPECDAVLMPSLQRGFLVAGCQPRAQRAALPGAGVWAKRRQAMPACVLGYGLEVHGGAYDGAQGLYVGSAARVYEQVGGEHRVVWHDSDCGWVLQRGHWGPAPVVGLPACADRVEAANWAFGQVGEAYDRGVCSAATWAGGSYCVSPLFRMLCPASCGVAKEDCAGDSDLAAGELLAIAYGECKLDDCGCSHAALRCSDPVVAAACPSTCAEEGDALSVLGETHPSAGHAAAHHRARRLEQVPWGDALRSFLLAAPRRLRHGDWEDVYASFPMLDYAACTAATSPSAYYYGASYYGGAPSGDPLPDYFSAGAYFKGESYYYLDALVYYSSANLSEAYWGDVGASSYYVADAAPEAPIEFPYYWDEDDAVHAGYPAHAVPLFERDAMLAKALYDIRKFKQPLPEMRFAHSCPQRGGFRTHSFMASLGPLLPMDGHRDLCSSKCAFLTTTTTTTTTSHNLSNASNETVGMEPRPEYVWTAQIRSTPERDFFAQELDFCFADPGVTSPNYTYSVCLPREDCEELCAETEGCAYVTMARSGFHCFLHGGDCGNFSCPVDYTLEYDLLVKDPGLVEAFDTRSFEGQWNCSWEETIYPDAADGTNLTNLTREACEALCTALDCTEIHVAVHPGNGSLAFCHIGKDCVGGQDRYTMPIRACYTSKVPMNVTECVVPEPEDPDRDFYYFPFMADFDMYYYYDAEEMDEGMHRKRRVQAADLRRLLANCTGVFNLSNGASVNCSNVTMGLLADTDTCVDVSRIVMVDETECVETESCGDVNCTFMVQHPVLYHSTVSRHPSEPCYVEILDAPDILHNHFLTQVSEAEYLSSDNVSRLVWIPSVNGSCAGWSLETNLARTSDMLANCSDQPLAANLYLFEEDEAQHKRFVCAYGVAEGLCDDPVFTALCAFSCRPLEVRTIEEIEYAYQELTWTVGPQAYGCAGDLDAAAVLYGTDYHKLDFTGLPTEYLNCTTVHLRLSLNSTDEEPISACVSYPWSPVLAALCPVTCRAAMLDAAAFPTKPPSDEDDPAGADDHAEWDEWWTRKLKATAPLATPRVDGTPPIYWHREFRDFHGQTLCPDETVPTVPNSFEIFRWEPELDETAALQYLCRDAPLCPVLTSCSLEQGHFDDESHRSRSGAPPSRFVGGLDEAARGAFIAGFLARALFSERRAEAYSHESAWHLGQEVMRTAPGAPRVRVMAIESYDGVYSLVTLVSAVAASGRVAEQEFGRPFPVPAGLQEWKTDVTRLELLTASGSFAAPHSYGIVDFYAPTVRRLRLMMFDRGVDDLRGMDVEDLGATITPRGQGWFRAEGLPMNYDYVGTEDVYECEMDNGGCDPHATCTEMLMAPPKCACRWPWSGDGQVCYPAEEEVSPEETVLLTFTATTKLLRGWALREVEVYADTKCEVRVEGVTAAGPTFPGFEAAGIVDGKTDQDHGWRSLCAHCDPESFPGDAGMASFSLLAPAHSPVGCVRLVNAADEPFPSRIRVDRGHPLVATWELETEPLATSLTPDPDVEQLAGVDIILRCGAEGVQVFGEILSGSLGAISANNETGWNLARDACECQQRCVENRHFGCRSWRWFEPTLACQLQGTPFEAGEGFYGAARGVGWQTWAENVKPTREFRKEEVVPEEPYEGKYWTSGVVPTSLLSFTATPAFPRPGEKFEIEVHGVNLPTKGSNGYDLSWSQRLKVVEAGAPCWAKQAVDSDPGCTSVLHKRDTRMGTVEEEVFTVCGPAPSSADDKSVRFGGFAIRASADAATFDVCYCGGMNCQSAARWHKVPGELSAAPSTFVWSTDPDPVPRHLPETGNVFRLSVQRPAFATFSHVHEWGVRLIKRPFDCRQDTASTLAITPSVNESTFDVKVWHVEMLELVAQQYTVCFSESGQGWWAPIPRAKGGLYLAVRGSAGDASRSRGFFTPQRLSASTLNAQPVVLRGTRLGEGHMDSRLMVAKTCKDPVPEWMNGTTEYNFAPHALHGAHGLSFSLHLAGLAAGEYTACLCDAQARGNNTANGTGTWYFATEECAERSPALNTSEDIPPEWAAHRCEDKCPECLGEECWCDADPVPDSLCVPSSLCRAACDATPACTGFTMAEGSTSCVLLGDSDGSCKSAGARALPGVTRFLKKSGEPCQLGWAEYKPLGPVYVSNRAHSDLTFVIPPGVPSAIEVSGTDLSDALGVSMDRVMVVDRDASCGADAPARAVLDPVDWDDWAPHSVQAAAAEPEEIEWVATPGYFCPSNNLRVLDYEEAAKHQCYAKCGGKQRCIGADCFCNGMYKCRGDGCDTPDTNSLCADEALCRKIASRLYNVVASFDMHQSMPRCFLNVRSADECVHPIDRDEMVRNADYTIHAAVPPPETTGISADGSRPNLLRFGPLHLRTAGTFKVCFCDSSLMNCNQRSAYGLAVGMVHVSGVSCLLSAGKQRGACAQQLKGGLRCYPGEIPVPGVRAALEEAAPRSEPDFCLYGPKEETMRDPLCRPVGPLPTPSPTPSPVPAWMESGVGNPDSGLLGPSA